MSLNQQECPLSFSQGTFREQSRPGRVRHCSGATGQGTAGEALGAQKDQASGHDKALPAGKRPDLALEFSTRTNTRPRF